ncbi:hypothetical protein FQA39_LY04418 [Lamprigera yunnana]|nr:hypothetical protein FQA39_LY04418 [Lamprigera yunnana]
MVYGTSGGLRMDLKIFVWCKMNFIFVLVNLAINVLGCNGQIVENYLNLINTETTRALQGSLPKNSFSYIPAREEIFNAGIYDYIIVGAGSAGAVIASRLSEDPNISVLLIEAGGYPTDFTDIPKYMYYLQGREFDWGFESTPQKTTCLGMVDQICPIPRGKGLGGGSLINGMMYVRGNKKDFDDWYMSGNFGWNYAEVLRLFKKSENFVPISNSSYHGRGGPLDVNYAGPNSRYLNVFLRANAEMGRKIVDYNGEHQLGAAQIQFTINNGRRESTYKAFLQDNLNRKNLKILTHSLVTKLLITNNIAYGVRFNSAGRMYNVKSRREVILSAGAIGSPQLLMLSGIGPEEDLSRLGIKVIKNLNVGKDLQDHATFWELLFVTNHTESIPPLKESVVQYLNGYGPLTKPINVEGVAFLNTNVSDRSGQPDIELLAAPVRESPVLLQKIFNYNNDAIQMRPKNLEVDNTFSIAIILLHPKSRGSLKLKSNSPYEYPNIDLNLLSDKNNEDIETMYKGIKLVLDLMDTKAFKEVNAKLTYASMPTCKRYPYLSRDFWYCQLRQLTFHVYHHIGTCKMGSHPWNGAVVNHQLKVFGIQNLRVADASIIPTITSGHTNAVAVMIGEKVSELIKSGQ